MSTTLCAPTTALTGARLTPVFKTVRPTEAAVRWAALLAALTIHGVGFAIADLAYQTAEIGMKAPATLQITLLGDAVSAPASAIHAAPAASKIASSTPHAAPHAAASIRPPIHHLARTAAVAAAAAGSVPTTVAGIVYNPRPAYPRRARYRGLEGRVVLEVLVAANGRAREVTIQHSSGYVVLDQAAVTGIRRWRFTPASRAGLAIPARIRIPVVFRLR